MTHLQNLPCNAHEIAEMEVPSGTVKDSVQSEIGAASYGTLSLINHSCDPNVVRHYHSSHAVVTSVRTILAGEIIMDKGEDGLLGNKKERLTQERVLICTFNDKG